MTPLPISIVEYLTRLVDDSMKFGDPADAAIARRASDALKRLAEEPREFTLAALPDGDWRIGRGKGMVHRPTKGEVTRGLAAIEIAVAFPGDPVSLYGFLEPGKALANPISSARKMISTARAWIDLEVDVCLADVLRGVHVGVGHHGEPAATYAPNPLAIFTTSYGNFPVIAKAGRRQSASWGHL